MKTVAFDPSDCSTEGVAPATEPTRPFNLRRLGVLMEPREQDPLEVWGVLNPASARGPNGDLYLFPRLVAENNYSRIGRARVHFDAQGNPASVERLGIALEPVERYEKNPVTGGGCEDPRITYVPSLGRYVMTYTAFSPVGPRIAFAVSRDLLTWERIGLARFGARTGEDFNAVDNKDALLFPDPVLNPRTGRPALALIHRPTFAGTPVYSFMDRWWDAAPSEGAAPSALARKAARAERPSIWISYSDSPETLDGLTSFNSHRRILSPQQSWEKAKVGGGAPPIMTPHGWLLLYHGVVYRSGHFRYSAGAAVLDKDNPERVLYRSRSPIMSPNGDDQLGIVPDVVFPTAVDQRVDLGLPDRLDVYYGMADSRIGVATLTLPRVLQLAPTARRKSDHLHPTWRLAAARS